DANTAHWILKVKLGGIVEVADAAGVMVKLRLVGLLHESIFQSELLVSEEHFLEMLPRQEGYNFFLIDSPPKTERQVKRQLERNLASRGFEVTSTVERVREYLAVENTYLATFQILGGLGLMLGALGLAVVLVRSVWERRGELALFRALGYRQRALGWLLLAENGFLLLAG